MRGKTNSSRFAQTRLNVWALQWASRRRVAYLLLLSTALAAYTGRNVAAAAVQDTAETRSSGNPVLSLGHSSSIRDMAISPDGRQLATSSYDRCTILWDLHSGSELRVLHYPGQVQAVAFLNNGKLATAASDGTIVVWESSTGLAQQSAHVRGGINQLLASPDGKQLWVTSWDHGVSVLDSHTLTVIRNYPDYSGVALAHAPSSNSAYAVVRWHDSSITLNWWSNGHVSGAASTRRLGKPITAAAVATDGLTQVVGTQDGIVYTLRGQAASPTAYPDHNGPITSVDIDISGTSFVSVNGTDHLILVRSASTGAPEGKFSENDGFPNKALMLSAGEVLIATCDGNSARLINMGTRRETNFRGIGYPMFKVQNSQNHRYLLTSGWYGARVWSATPGGFSRTFPMKGAANGAAISPNGTKVYTTEDLPFDSAYYLIAREVASGKEIARLPHRSSITAAVYSADRRLLATGELIGDIHLWDTSTGKEIQKLMGHQGSVTSVTFGQGNETLLSQGDDNTARVWSTSTGQELWREDAFAFHGDAFSPSGRLLAALFGGGLRVFDVKRHAQLAQLEGVESFAFSIDDTLLTVNRDSSSLGIWTENGGQQEEIMKVKDPEVARVHSLTKQLALVCEQGGATVIELSTGKSRRKFDNAACSDGATPYVILGNRYPEIWNPATLKLLKRLPTGLDDMDSFDVSADGRYLIVATSDFTFDTWDLISGRRIGRVPDSYRLIKTGWTRASLPALSEAGDRYFASFENEGTPQTAIDEWPLKPESKPHRLFVQPYAIQSLDVSPDGERLLTCSGNATLRLLKATTGQLVAQKEDACTHAEFSPSGKLITTTRIADERPPQIWTSDLKRALPPPDYRPSGVRYVAVSAGGEKMLTVEAQRTIRLWDLMKGEETALLPPLDGKGEIRGAELMLAGGLALVARSTGEIQGWQTSNGAPWPVEFVPHGPIRSIRRAQTNDQLFLVLGEDGAVRIWNLSFKLIRSIDPPDSPVTSADLSSDGRLVLIATADGVIRVWDLESGRLLHTSKLPAAAMAASFSPSKRKIVALCRDSIARIYAAESGKVNQELKLPHNETIVGVDYLGDFLRTTTTSGTTLWSDEGRLFDVFKDGQPVAQSLTYIDQNKNLIVVHAGATIQAAQLSRYRFSPIKLFREQATSVAASPDGRSIAVGFSTGWLRFWDTASSTWLISSRASKSDIGKLAYSTTGSTLLLAADDRPIEFDVAANTVAKTYPESPNINDLSYAGNADQLVLTATSEGRVRVLSRATGGELCSLILGPDGAWWVATPEGLYDGHDVSGHTKLAAPSNPFDPQNTGMNTGRTDPQPGLWASIFAGKTSVLEPVATQVAAVPDGPEITFDPSMNQTSDALPTETGDLAPTGLGLQYLVELFANLLGTKDHLRVNNGTRIETTPTGDMEIGTGALEHVFKGESFSTALGLTAFIVAHESWHSRQAPKYTFGSLSDEDHRLLECEADVLGTIDAVNLVASQGASKEELQAYAGVRLSQSRVAAMTTLEGRDSAHPTEAQRQWAVEFGNARLAGRVVTDPLGLLTLDRRFDARLAGGDEPWATGVCKRILHYHLADQGKIAVSIQNERRIGDRWEADLIYRNLSDSPIEISHHVRIIGNGNSILTGKPFSGPANIDGYLTSFSLAPREERIISVSLASLELPGERVQPSAILYNNTQQDNWMSVEASKKAPEVPHPPAHATPLTQPSIEQGTTCSETDSAGQLTDRQSELGTLLFQISNDVSSGFKSFQRGGAIVGSFGSEMGQGIPAEVALSHAEGATILIDSHGVASLAITLGSDLKPAEAEKLFASTVGDLKAICSNFAMKTDVRLSGPLTFKSVTLPNFTSTTDVEVTLLQLPETLSSTVDVTVRQRSAK